MRYFIILFLSLTAFTVKAQQDWEAEGEVEDAEIIIVKDRDIVLPSANRKFEKVPPLPVEIKSRKLNFQVSEFEAPYNPVISGSRVLRIKPEPKPRIFENYVRAGYGNFGSPLGELSISTRAHPNYQIGLFARHLSANRGPVRDEDSGNSDNHLNINGLYTKNNSILSGKLNYDRNAVRYYGFDVPAGETANTLKQVFNEFNITAGYAYSSNKKPFKTAFNLSFNQLTDEFNTSENEGVFKNISSYNISEQLSAGLNFDLHFGTLSFSQDISRNLFRFNPYVKYSKDKYEIKVGLIGAGENDMAPNADQFHIFPDLSGRYFFTNDISAFLEFNGNVERITYASLARENRWVGQNIDVFNTINNFTVKGGLKGTVWNDVAFLTGIRFSNYDNLYFFANEGLSDSTQFIPLYDSNISLFNFFASLSIEKGASQASLRLDTYNWNTDSLQEAFHRPNFSVGATYSYFFSEKLSASTALTVLSGIEAFNTASGNAASLDPIFDLALEINYAFSKRVGLFMEAENLISNEYERYWNYPVRGIRVIGGLNFSF